MSSVLVRPASTVVTECAIRALSRAGIEATDSEERSDVCAVVDLLLPDKAGVPVAQGDLPQLLVAEHLDEEVYRVAAECGADAVVEWTEQTADFVDAVNRLLAGTGPRLPQAEDPGRGVLLTRREHDVARLIVSGASNRAIAMRLSISPHTARTHVQHVLAKLEVSHRAGVAARLRDLDEL